MRKKIATVVTMLFVTLLLPFYQNCGKPLTVIEDSIPMEENTSIDGSLATPVPSPTAQPSPTEPPVDTTPSPTPVPKRILRSYIYVGAPGSVACYELTHSNNSLRALPVVSTPSFTPGWFAYDSASKRVFTVNSSGAGVRTFLFNPLNGRLSPETDLPLFSQGVHLNVIRMGDKYWGYSSSYSSGKFEFSELPMDGSTAVTAQTLTYSAGAHTHSSTLDSRRRLVFVANKDEERVVVYRQADSGALTLLTSIALNDPRIVFYDETFDKLYVVTESDTGQSFIKIYQISEVSGGYAFSEAGSFSMGRRGSDLKIEHRRRHLLATVREAGSEGIWAVPLTETGLFESSRLARFIPTTQKEARSLQVTADGQYLALTLNNAANVADLLIYKVEYSATNEISSVTLSHEVNVGPQAYPSNYLIDVEE